MPSSTLLGATVNSDTSVKSDDEFDALDSFLLDELAGSTADVQLVELRHYGYEDVDERGVDCRSDSVVARYAEQP